MTPSSPPTTPARPAGGPLLATGGRNLAQPGSAAGLAFALAVALLAPASLAAPQRSVSPAAPPASAPGSRIVEVRIALSAPAAQGLSEARVRRLLEIELEESAVLAPGVSGPLGDHVAYVWIDELNPAQVLIEVRTGDRGVARRELRVAGIAGDVAARLVAIAASEMIRSQMQPIRPPRRPPPPRRPSAAEIERATRRQPTLTVAPSAVAALLPRAAALLAGPSLAVGFRYQGVGEALFARWLTGAGAGGAARWFEVGVLADERVWLRPDLRLTLGGEAALSSVHFAGAHVLADAPGASDTWSARAGALLGIEARLGPATWLAISLEPGAVLRPARYEGATGGGALEGVWLGLNLAVPFEWAQKPAIAN